MPSDCEEVLDVLATDTQLDLMTPSAPRLILPNLIEQSVQAALLPLSRERGNETDEPDDQPADDTPGALDESGNLKEVRLSLGAICGAVLILLMM